MRIIGVILGLVLVIGGLAFVKASQIGKLIGFGKAMQAAGPPPEMVGSGEVKAQTWEGTLTSTGTVAGAKSVTLSNDSAGRVKRIRFESGALVKQGQILVELDTSVERAQLASARSRQALAETTVKRSRQLVSQGVLAQAQLDNDEATLRTAKTEASALSAQIDRRIVRAPFAGRLGIREVNVGQYLNPGTPLATVEALGDVYVDFSLPQQALGAVKPGMGVRVELGGKDAEQKDSAKPQDKAIVGTVSAIDPRVDETTRNLKLRATVPNDDEGLRPGMFVNVTVVMPKTNAVLIVPATAVVHAPYGDSVFVIEDRPADAPGKAETDDGKPIQMARQQFVRLGTARGDFVAITDGVKAGERIVTQGAFKLKNKSPIVVDDTVKLDPKLDPHPENH